MTSASIVPAICSSEASSSLCVKLQCVASFHAINKCGVYYGSNVHTMRIRLSLPPQRKLATIPLSTLFARHRSPLLAQVRPLHFALAKSAYRYALLRTVSQRRALFTDALPDFLVPPVIFAGLLLTLWTYKCFMTVVFQDKVIYMPYMPPFARSEKILNYADICKPVQWEERRIQSLDGTKISLCIGTAPRETAKESASIPMTHIVICYFQGNGSSTPPRLPLLSQVLRLVDAQRCESIQYTLVALSYRGYWTSSGRASQVGIELDAQAMLQWIAIEYVADVDTRIVLWGQSIGAGVASTAAATYLSSKQQRHLQISGLILETPFTSIKSMLLALYPQKWLPYQYLHPFLWNHWNSEEALRRIATCEGKRPSLFLMPAGRDEVVPPTEIAKIERLCQELRLEFVRKDVIGALHTEASMRREGQAAIAKFIIALSNVK